MKFTQKKARAWGGKVARHHWFKSARVNILGMLDRRRAEQESARLREGKRGEMYASIQELFRRRK